MATISQNQWDYLSNLVKGGGGNGEWAKSQLNGATVYAPPAAAKTTTTSTTSKVAVPTTQANNNRTEYGQGNNYGVVNTPPSTPTPQAGSTYKGWGSPFIQPSTTPPTPEQVSQSQNKTPYSQGNNYGVVYYPGMNSSPTSITQQPTDFSKSTTPTYTAPATSYTGAEKVIGSFTGGDLNQGYQGIFNSVRAQDPNRNEINTWQDKNGVVYDTTKMTPQQIYALSLSKDGNPNAAALLKGMGLDMNGNPTSLRPPTAEEAKVGGAQSNTNVPAPARWDTNASAQDRLSHFASNPLDAQNEILALKQLYGAGGSQSRLNEIGNWANQVRTAAGIKDTDAVFGNNNGVDANTQNKYTQDMINSIYYPGMDKQQGDQTQQGNQTDKLNRTGTQGAGKNMFNLSDEDFAGVTSQVDAQMKDERDAIVQAISGATASLKNDYDYLNTITKDNRAIENSTFQENNNPFNGMTSFRKSMMDRDRSIQDTALSKDLNTRLATLNQKLADFDSGSATKKQALIAQLAKDLVGMRIQEAGVTGMYNDEKTVAAKAQDAASERQTKIDNWNAYIDSVGLTGYLGTGAKADWSLLGSKTGDMTPAAKVNLLQSEGAAINNEIAKLNLDYLPTKQKLEIQQLQKQIAQIGKAPYRSAEDVEYDKIKLDTAKEQLNQLRNPKTKTTDFKSSTEFASDVAHLKNNPNEASKLDSNPQPFIEAYGYDGYLALRKAAGLED